MEGNNNPQTRDGDAQLYRMARKRVALKMGWLTHLTVYLLVNGALLALSWIRGDTQWVHFPMIGWGVGLAIHGIVTLFGLYGSGVRERMLDSEIERLRRQRQQG
jgi:hypothetical protein